MYLADDTRLQRPVVIKMLHRRRGSGEKLRSSILREARLASAIEHPNVCAIYEVGEADGRAFIVMQYVPGQTLAKMIESGPLNLQLALSIAIQVADGLAAAHGLGIFHRDLKPANIIVTEGGLVKILDFGLAKRESPDEEITDGSPASAKRRSSSVRGGTLAYMAPEQFVGRASELSDIFAFGTILYEMMAGRHPFIERSQLEERLNPRIAQNYIARAIQFHEPTDLLQLRPELPPDVVQIVAKALVKNPPGRYQSSAEMREALRLVIRSLNLTPAPLAADPTGLLPAGVDVTRKAGLFSMLVERFMRSDSETVGRKLVSVLPFTAVDVPEAAPLYGQALADAVAARLAKLRSLIVRPVGRLPPAVPSDPIELGRRMLVDYVLHGNYLRSEGGFTLNWQLLDVASGTVASGGNVAVDSFDLVAVQNEVCDQVFAALQGTGQLAPVGRVQGISLSSALSDEYVQARALVSRFLLQSSRRGDLDDAERRFSTVLASAPEFAPAHSGLGIVHLQYVIHGLAGVSRLRAAQKCFERALQRDPELTEAQLFRVYSFLARGEKESARHAVHHLLQTAESDFDVHVVTGVILRLDGLYDEAMKQFNRALQLNPAHPTLIYNHRARVYHYQGQLELARQEIAKGLALEPEQPLLKTTLGYLCFRGSDLENAIRTLESVLERDPNVRIAYPTLAMCCAAAGDRSRAATLVTDETLTTAEADCEMAYRLATYFAVDGDTAEALHWLRKAIYLGNENYPWFAKNPAWTKLQKNEDFQRLLLDVKKSYKTNLQRWKRLLAGNRPGHEQLGVP